MEKGLITVSGSFFITHCHRDNLAEEPDCWAEKERFSSQPTNLHGFFFFWGLPSFTCKWISPPQCTRFTTVAKVKPYVRETRSFRIIQDEGQFKVKWKRTYWSTFVSWRKLLFIYKYVQEHGYKFFKPIWSRYKCLYRTQFQRPLSQTLTLNLNQKRSWVHWTIEILFLRLFLSCLLRNFKSNLHPLKPFNIKSK